MKNLSRDGRDDATGYAVDNTAEGGREFAHDAVRVVGSGVKKTVERGRKAAKQAKAKKQEEERRDETNSAETNEEAPVPETPENESSPQIDRDDHRPQAAEKKVSEGGSTEPPPQTNPPVQETANARQEAASQRNESIAKPQAAKAPPNGNDPPSSRPTQNPQNPKTSVRREPIASSAGISGRTESGRTVNRLDTGRNSGFARTVAANPAGQATQKVVRQEQGRQAFMMAKQKAIASARTQRSIQKRLAAVIEQTRKAAASIGAIAGGAGLAIIR